jgi:hypothetical protein
MGSKIAIVLGKKANRYERISAEGMQRVKGLFILLAKERDINYVIFSGADTNNSGISEAKAMYQFFVEHCNEKLLEKNSVEIKNMISEGILNEAYSIKSNQLFGARRLEVYLEQEGLDTSENNFYSKKLIYSLETSLSTTFSPVYVSHDYHLNRLKKKLGDSFGYEPVETLLKIETLKPQLREHLFKFLTSIGCDNPKLKKPIYNLFHSIFRK